MRTLERILALVLPLGLAGCLTPTEITVDVYTEIPCDAGAEVSVTLASSLDALATSAPSSAYTGCLDGHAGHVGSVVIAPAGDDEKLVTFEVATRQGMGSSDVCLMSPLPMNSGCIVARRQLRYSPHTNLTMRIDLRDVCVDFNCPLDQTCVEGVCVSAAVPPQCSGNCDESSLVPQSVHIVPTPMGFTTAWRSAEPDGTYSVRLQELGPDGAPIGAPSKPILQGPAVITGLLLGYDGTSYDLGVQAGLISFLVAGADGTVSGGPTKDTNAGDLLADHGLPYTGVNPVLTRASPTQVSFDFFQSNLLPATWYWIEGETVTAGTTAFDGTTIGATSYAADGCQLYTMPIANMASGSGRKLGDTDCTNAQLASLAGGGGFHVVTASSTKPSHVSYIAVDDTGNTTTSMPTNVAPLDGQIYGVAQVVGTPKGASIFFVPSGKTTAQLYRADVDTTATMITPAAPVAGVVVAGQSYEVIFSSYSGVIGVAWYGRTDSPGADANGIHTTTLIP